MSGDEENGWVEPRRTLGGPLAWEVVQANDFFTLQRYKLEGKASGSFFLSVRRAVYDKDAAPFRIILSERPHHAIGKFHSQEKASDTWEWIEANVAPLLATKDAWYEFAVFLFTERARQGLAFEPIALPGEEAGVSDIPESEECVVCMDDARTHAIVSCGHQVLCAACATNTRLKKCPVCRAPKDEKGVIRVYR